MKLLAFFSIVVAAMAVLLAARGSQGPHLYMLLATALGEASRSYSRER
jgi:hypothetical protein